MTELAGVASATGVNGVCEARTKLPNFTDLNGPHEIAVLYTSFFQNWDNTAEYSIKHLNEHGVYQVINLSPQPYTIESEALGDLSRQVKSMFGANMRSAPIKFASKNTSTGVTHLLRLQKYSEADLEPALAKLLGLEEHIANDTGKAKDFEIGYTRYIPPIESRVYLISCEQIKPNFVNVNGSLSKVLEVIHVPHADASSGVVQYNSPYPIYHQLDETLHHSLQFRLYKQDGEPVQSTDCHFYLKYHIRPR